MKRELYKHLIDNEKEAMEFDELVERIESFRAQSKKDWTTSAWIPLATIAPIIGALCAAVAYLIAKS